MKVGFNLQSIRFPFFSPPNGRGTYTFSGFYTSVPGKSFTGYGPADFLVNEMETASVPQYNKLNFSHWYRAAYVQDDWRVTQRLTLNLGLQYDYFQPLEEIKGKFANFSMQFSGAETGQGVLTYTKSQQNAYLAPQFLNLLSANNISLQYTGKSSLVDGQKLNFAGDHWKHRSDADVVG